MRDVPVWQLGGAVSQEVLEPSQETCGVVLACGLAAVAVALIGVADHSHGGLAEELQGTEELQALGWMDAGVGAAVRDEQRGARVGKVMNRAALEGMDSSLLGIMVGVDGTVFLGDIGGQRF